MNRYHNPVRTVEGPGCARQLPALLGEMNLERRKILLLVWDQSVLEHPAFVGLLREHAYEVRPLVFQASNPTVEQLYEVYRQTRAFQPEVVIAVGGGSILDVGKSLCCLYGKELQSADTLRELIEEKAYGHPTARWIGVPTTAGTGSETTCWATIWDPKQDAKRSVECQENYAWAALVDPELAAGMPLELAVSSALDAVAHAVESYWAKGSNCVSRALALEAVRTMARIAEHTEQNIHYKKRFYNYDFKIHNTVDALSHATCGMAIDVNAKAIVACSLSGMTVRMVSRFRPPMDILGLTTNERTWRRLALSWGVVPAMCDMFTSTDVLFYIAKNIARDTLGLERGDKIVITGGVTDGRSGNTNLIKVEEI